MDDPSTSAITLEYDNNNNNRIMIDLWDDKIEPEINPVAKMLNRDLWLTNDENEISNLLESLITIHMSSSNFVMFGGITAIIIIMNRFKTNKSILCKCCHLMVDLFERGSYESYAASISEDNRCMRCLVQCMNQFPKNLDIQGYSFVLLSMITKNNRVGTDLLIDVFKFDELNDSLSGLKSVLVGMKEFSSDPTIQKIGCSILYNIAAYKEHKMTIREHGAITILASALETCEIKKSSECYSSFNRE